MPAVDHRIVRAQAVVGFRQFQDWANGVGIPASGTFKQHQQTLQRLDFCRFRVAQRFGQLLPAAFPQADELHGFAVIRPRNRQPRWRTECRQNQMPFVGFGPVLLISPPSEAVPAPTVYGSGVGL